ncbi:hypothetical protein YC2023_028302 [Brassica napus]
MCHQEALNHGLEGSDAELNQESYCFSIVRHCTRHVWSVVNVATVYHIWKQRNNALHNQVSHTATEVFRFIDRDIKTIITSDSKVPLNQCGDHLIHLSF